MKIEREKTDEDLEEEDLAKRLDFAKSQLKTSKEVFEEKLKRYLKSHVFFNKLVILQDVKIGGKVYKKISLKEALIYSKEKNLIPKCLHDQKNYHISIIGYEPKLKRANLFVKKRRSGKN